MISTSKVDYDNITAFDTGVPVSNLNPAIVNRFNDKFQICLDACESFYTSRQIPWLLIVPEYLCNKSLESLLQKNAFEPSDEGVAMSLAIENIQPVNISSKLNIKAMNDDLKTWSIPLLHGFGSVPAIIDVYTNQHLLASKNHSGIFHYSGFLDDTVVCSLTLTIRDNEARFDDIATIPGYQKQGHATALIYAVLKDVAQLNFNRYFLEASTSGLSIYKKIGFKPLFKNYYYEIIPAKRSRCIDNSIDYQ